VAEAPRLCVPGVVSEGCRDGPPDGRALATSSRRSIAILARGRQERSHVIRVGRSLAEAATLPHRT
jgi:hypothetical protein